PVLEYEGGKTPLATAWAPDGEILSLTEDGTILKADPQSIRFTNSPDQQLDPKPGGLSSAVFSADGKWLLTLTAANAKAQLGKWEDASVGKKACYHKDAQLEQFPEKENVRAVACDGIRLVVITSNPAHSLVHSLVQHPSDPAFQDELRKRNVSEAEFTGD